jgi:hypothetical protein
VVVARLAHSYFGFYFPFGSLFHIVLYPFVPLNYLCGFDCITGALDSRLELVESHPSIAGFHLDPLKTTRRYAISISAIVLFKEFDDVT